MIYKILFLILLCTNFFGIINIPNTVLLLIILTLGYTKLNYPTPFRKPINLMFIGIFLSFIPAYLFREQSFMESFKASVNYFYIILFFVLIKLNPNIKQTEKVVEYLAIATSIVYIIQFILIPKGIIFLPIPEASLAQMEAIRFRIPASGIFSLGYFYSLNKYLVLKKNKYLLLTLLCFTPIMLQAFRTMIACIILFTLIMIYINNKRQKAQLFKYIFLLIVVSIVIIQIPVIADKITYMLEKQSSGEETFNNKDYIRYITLNYYLFDYFKSPLEYLLGSGTAYVDSKFGLEEKVLASNGIYWVDWGLIGGIWIVGPVTVFSMLWFSIKTTFLQKNKDQLYVCIWYLYLILSSITTIEFLRPGNFIIHSIALYLAYKINQLQKSRQS